MADVVNQETVVTRPDPTERVNQSIKEAVKSLQDLLEAKIDKNTEVFAEKINAITAHSDSNRQTLEAMINGQQTLSKEMSYNSKVAIDAAFASAGTAADKQEKSFIKLLDTLGATVTDLKDRIVVMEGKSSVVDPTINKAISDNAIGLAALKESRDLIAGRHQQFETSTGTWIAIIAALAALALVIVDIAGVMKVH